MKQLILIAFCSVALLLLPSGPARAQTPDELESFQQASGVQSVLFRGKQATRITFPANGNPYWEQPEFHSGEIVFEGNLYRDVLLNIDAHEQRALARHPSSTQTVALTPALTSSLVMDGRRFVGIGPGEELPEGFYEVFGTGPEQVYKHVDKVLNSSVADVNGAIIGYYDDNYRSDVFRYFGIRTTYYFRDAEGRFSRLKSRKNALLRKFPDRRKDIRKALKASGAGSIKNFDDYCKALLNVAAL